MATNNAGGPYNDDQARHVRLEHDPQLWYASHFSDLNKDEKQEVESSPSPK